MISQIELAQMLTQKTALSLEIKGLTKRGRSAYSIIKDRYGLRGNKKSVYTQFCELVEKEKGNVRCGD